MDLEKSVSYQKGGGRGQPVSINPNAMLFQEREKVVFRGSLHGVVLALPDGRLDIIVLLADFKPFFHLRHRVVT
jgi:hypothetical protein